MNNSALRRQNLVDSLPQDVGCFLVSNPINVTYLTGFTGDSTYLILTRDKQLLISDARYTEQIANECPGLEAHIRLPGKLLPQAVGEILKKLGVSSVGFESAHLTVADLETLRSQASNLTWIAEGNLVEKQRIIKDASEIAEIREAVAIAEKAFTVFRALLRPQDNEKDLSDAMEYYIRKAGGKCASFPTIIAVGETAALPHAPLGNKRIEEAELVLVDWGASGRLYKSDLTRVLATHTISPKLQEVYEVVLRAQERALKKIRPGVKGHDVDAEARSVIAEAGFGEFFAHSLGNGIGLQVHEAPSLRPNSEFILQPGMVVTVEPGIYLPGWGGVRIEDDVLVTPDGCEVLTSVPKDLGSISV